MHITTAAQSQPFVNRRAAYEAGLLEKTEFETRILNTRQRVKQLEEETRTLSEQAAAFEQVQDQGERSKLRPNYCRDLDLVN
jgi:hypothetical protein